jgi:hypothetical protein
MGNAGSDHLFALRGLDIAIKERNLRMAAAWIKDLDGCDLERKVRITDIVRQDNFGAYDQTAGNFVRDFAAARNPGLVELAALVDLLDPVLFSREALLELTAGDRETYPGHERYLAT